MTHINTYGYFEHYLHTIPVYDPGLTVPCVVCGKPLGGAIKTISLMLDGDDRSYFYRTHKVCYDALAPESVTNVDSLIIDAIASARNTN